MPVDSLFPELEPTKRERLLERLRPKSGKHMYSRYDGGFPLRYVGGKSRAVGHVIERLPEGTERIVSPFFGGGSVEFACANELGIEVIGSDVFGILVNYWQVQLSEPEELAERIRQWSVDQETYRSVKARLREHWDGTRLIDDRMELAAHYWYNHNLSFGPGFLGWLSSIYSGDPAKAERLIGKVEAFRAPGVSVAERDFKEAIADAGDDFIYADPPYFLGGDSKMFVGLYPQRNFPVHHDGFDHEALRDLLHAHRGGFILSYNDCGTIRDWYSGFEIAEVSWQYSHGQGETRMGRNRIERGDTGHVKESHEIIAFCPPRR